MRIESTRHKWFAAAAILMLIVFGSACQSTTGEQTYRTAYLMDVQGARVEKSLDSPALILQPQEQILVPFPTPKAGPGINYAGQIRVAKGKLVMGIKPKDGVDAWNYPLPTGSWLELPPPGKIDFDAVRADEWFLFFWVPPEGGETEFSFRGFTGVREVKIEQ